MTDEELVKRLRKLADDMEKHAAPDWDEHEDVASAAAAIEALTAKVKLMDDLDYIIANGNLLAERDALEVKLSECLERNALLEARLGKAVELLTLCRDMFDEVAHSSDPLSRMLNDDLAFERWGEQP